MESPRPGTAARRAPIPLGSTNRKGNRITDLHQALGLEDPGRMAICTRTAELVAPIAEATIACVFDKAAAEATNEGRCSSWYGGKWSNSMQA
jgi:hypothetical protein